MEPMYIARDKWMNILSYVDFSKLCHAIKYFTELNQKFGQEDITFLDPQVQSPLNVKINIIFNYNNMWIKLIQV